MTRIRWLMLKLLATLLCWLILPATTLQADDFPDRRLTMLIGFNPGGSTDIQAKALAPIIEEILGQPVDLLHLPGAGGAAAAAMLANSSEQGYIFQFGNSTPFTFSPLITQASFDLDSFRYVAGVSLDQTALVTGGSSPFSDWSGFLEYARANPGTVYASQTEFDRLVINYIAQRENLRLRVVPTTGGAGMAPLVLSGDAKLAYSGGTHSAFTDSGEMQVLVSTADDRLKYYSAAPTLRELGYDISTHGVRVVVVPKNTADHHVQVLAEAFEQATRDPRFIAVTEQTIRVPVVYLDEPALVELFKQQVQEHSKLIREVGAE